MTIQLDAPLHSTRSMPPQRAPQGARTARIPGLDVARCVACVGVIWLHFGPEPYSLLGYFRVPFFTMLLTYFAAAPLLAGEPRPLGDFIRTRAMRLLVPFALWAALQRIPHLAVGDYPQSYSPDALLMGLGALHLWFLPFGFCASLLAYGMVRLLVRAGESRRKTWALLLVGAGSLCAFIPVDPSVGAHSFWRYWLPQSGALLIGMALPVLLPLLARSRRSWGQAAGWSGVCALLATASCFVPYGLANFLGTSAGLALLLAGFAAPFKPDRSLWKYLGQLSYGMYLSHWMVGRIIYRSGFDSPEMALLRFVLILAGTVATAAVLLRVPWGGLLLGLPRRQRHVVPKPPHDGTFVVTLK